MTEINILIPCYCGILIGVADTHDRIRIRHDSYSCLSYFL